MDLLSQLIIQARERFLENVFLKFLAYELEGAANAEKDGSMSDPTNKNHFHDTKLFLKVASHPQDRKEWRVSNGTRSNQGYRLVD